jgi:hypothetical protein
MYQAFSRQGKKAFIIASAWDAFLPDLCIHTHSTDIY